MYFLGTSLLISSGDGLGAQWLILRVHLTGTWGIRMWGSTLSGCVWQGRFQMTVTSEWVDLESRLASSPWVALSQTAKGPQQTKG